MKGKTEKTKEEEKHMQTKEISRPRRKKKNSGTQNHILISLGLLSGSPRPLPIDTRFLQWFSAKSSSSQTNIFFCSIEVPASAASTRIFPLSPLLDWRSSGVVSAAAAFRTFSSTFSYFPRPLLPGSSTDSSMHSSCICNLAILVFFIKISCQFL